MQDRIQQDLKQAQLERNEIKVSTLRLLLSEIKNTQIDKGRVSYEDIIAVIQKEVKKRKEASEAFEAGGRQEAAQKELAEGEILESYLPQQLSDEHLTEIIEEAITEIGATSISQMGQVIGVVMGKVKGQADGSRVSLKVKEKLS